MRQRKEKNPKYTEVPSINSALFSFVLFCFVCLFFIWVTFYLRCSFILLQNAIRPRNSNQLGFSWHLHFCFMCSCVCQKWHIFLCVFIVNGSNDYRLTRVCQFVIIYMTFRRFSTHFVLLLSVICIQLRREASLVMGISVIFFSNIVIRMKQNSIYLYRKRLLSILNCCLWTVLLFPYWRLIQAKQNIDGISFSTQ